MSNLKFATYRLGKTSVRDIVDLEQRPVGLQRDEYVFDVTCTQVPADLTIGTVVFVWLGSDNSKGMPTQWKQGFKGVGIVKSLKRGASYNDESQTAISLKYIFCDTVSRLDVLREHPVAYYWCSELPIIGIDDHSNQTVRMVVETSERSRIGAFLLAMNAVNPSFRADIERAIPGIADYFLLEMPTPKTHMEAIIDAREEFRIWLANGRTAPKTAYENAVSYIPSIDDEYAEPTKHIWHGLREALYGKPSAVRIYQVKSYAELMENFGGLDVIFGDLPRSKDYDADRQEKCIAWANSSANHGSIRAAWRWYKKFWQWKDDQVVAGSVDLLTIALKLFKERRDGEEWNSPKGKKEWGYYAVNKGAREYFEGLKQKLLALPDDGVLARQDIDNLFLGEKKDGKESAFKPMWSGSNGTGWDNIKKGLDKDGGVKKVSDWLRKYAQSAGDVVVFATKEDDKDRPPGFGKSVESELLMKFHPDAAIKCGTMTIDVLQKLQLMQFKKPSDYTPTEYTRVLGIAADIKQRMDAMGITQMLENDKEADYLTVNEFLAWFHENDDLVKDKIREEVMSKKMRDEKPTKLKQEDLKDLGFKAGDKDDELLLRLLASLCAKPFAILAGHSGTGKSRYVKKLAYMMCNREELRKKGGLPGNYLILQVKPNWHDSTELLGFRNAMDDNKYQKTKLIEFLFRAYHFKDTPFFLCLDEMNLAPVEQYFAEFLSAMESKEPVPLNDITEKEENLFDLGCEWNDACAYVKDNGFSIPDNLFIVGTVNMDETTNQFSRKVLDRAFTIEMTDVDFTKFDGTNCPEPSYDDTLKDDIIKELLAGEFNATELDEEDRTDGSALISVQKKLEQTPFAIAYRFASEYTLLKKALKVFDKEGKINLDALDQAVLMKVLPRIAGEADYIWKVYGEKETDGLRGALTGKAKSLEKIEEILDRAKKTGAQYITFWP